MVTGWPNMANPADETFFFILGIAVTLLLANTAVMIYFVFRYSRKRNPVPGEVKENLSLEIIWIVVPTILVLAIFFVGWKGFQYMRTAPPDAMTVEVTAREWSWTFDYANGKQTGVLNVPVGKPVKLLITSSDVLHSLSIPAYRIKEDAVPGMRTHLWFLPDEIGSYDLFCTEYCGVGHSAMITKVNVMSQKDFDAWYSGEEKKTAPLAEEKWLVEKTDSRAHQGAELIREKGCVGCHTIDGTPKVGPTFKGLFGRNVTVITSGEERVITADETYIIRSIKDPTADIVKGFQPIMPAVQLTDDQIMAIVSYIKTLK